MYRKSLNGFYSREYSIVNEEKFNCSKNKKEKVIVKRRKIKRTTYWKSLNSLYPKCEILASEFFSSVLLRCGYRGFIFWVEWLV